jgi:hypothetical protein
MSKRKHDDSAADEDALSPLLALPAELWHQVARHLIPDADAMLCLLATHRAALFLVRYPLVQWLRSLFPDTEVSPDPALDAYMEFHDYLPDLEVLGPPIRARLAEGATDALLCELLYLVFIAQREHSLPLDQMKHALSTRSKWEPAAAVFDCWYVDRKTGHVHPLRELPGIRAQTRSLDIMVQIILNRVASWQRQMYEEYRIDLPVDRRMALHWNLVQHHATESERARFPLVECDHSTTLDQVVIDGQHLYAADCLRLRGDIYECSSRPTDRPTQAQQRQAVFHVYTRRRRDRVVYQRLAALHDLEDVILEGALRDVQDQ